MKQLSKLFALLLALLSVLACSLFFPGTSSQDPIPETPTDTSPAPDSFTLVELHPSHGKLNALLTEHTDRALAADRRPFVELYADWCPPCIKLDKSLTNERMVEAFRETYIIRLDIDDWNSQLSGTGFTSTAIPIFFELDGEGGPTGRTITGGAWGEDVPENMAPPLHNFFQDSSAQ